MITMITTHLDKYTLIVYNPNVDVKDERRVSSNGSTKEENL